MMRSLWTAASGMIAQQSNVDTISHNLSNVNTTGYKSQRAEFKSLLYQNMQTRTTTANGENKPVPAQVGLGTRIASINSSYTQGAMQSTENDTDFAIDGDGFFAVRGDDGETYYTRNGCFFWAMGPTGTTLCNSDGYPVLDSNNNIIVVPNGVTSGNMRINGDRIHDGSGGICSDEPVDRPASVYQSGRFGEALREPSGCNGRFRGGDERSDDERIETEQRTAVLSGRFQCTGGG